MIIVEGQIEPLKKLKESLSRRGITRFNSIGEINRFLRDYESKKKQLPSQIESALEAEIQDMQSTLISHQHSYDELKTNIRNEIKQKIQNLEVETKQASDKSNRNIFYKVFYFLKIKSLSRRKSNLENNIESILKKKTSNAEYAVAKLKYKIDDCMKNRKSIISERCKKSLDHLTYTKEVIDGLYTLVAGAIGESSVVKALQQLSDDCYLINDFSIKFAPPIYNKKENDRIFSIQIDHLLVCQSGVFLLETKNWSKTSVENLDLRSPVKQVLRTNFALFVLLNSDSKLNNIKLERHHWGAKKIPIRNIIVMINEKPKEEFKHVKVLSLNELIGYIQYFDQTFNGEEVKGIFEYLKKRM
jgi:ElaB/YqjD/DUF883 family membrane-anchored ribosome-binding protein